MERILPADNLLVVACRRNWRINFGEAFLLRLTVLDEVIVVADLCHRAVNLGNDLLAILAVLDVLVVEIWFGIAPVGVFAGEATGFDEESDDYCISD